MAIQRKPEQIKIVLPGVTNYDKLRDINNKKTSFNKFNPFVSQMYSDKIKKNHEADSLDARYFDEDVYNQLLMMQGLRNTGRNGSKTSYYGLTRKAKRQQLIRMSIADIVDEVLTKLTDEIVVNAQNKDAISLSVDDAKLKEQDVDEKFIKELSSYAQEQFDRIQLMYGLKENGKATSLWNKVYLFLIEGSSCYEIVWDNIENPTKIIGIHEIDAFETEEFYVNGIKYWKHHKQMGYKAGYVILYDTQIVNIDWSEASPNNRTSYLEQLIKSYNDLRIMDESSLIWTVTNAMFRMIVTVPTKGKSRIAAAQSLATEKNRMNDDIQYDSETGELNINGTANQLMQKTFWMGDGDSGTPDVKTVGSDGPDMNDMTRNEYYARRFYKAARVPYSRFDSSSAESWNVDARSQMREEITFGRFIQRIRDIIKMLILKPLYLQLAAKFPEIKNDQQILDAVTLRFNTYSVFEELMHLDILGEKIDAISKMNDSFTTDTPDGSAQIKFFSIEFLINKYLPELSKADLELNAKMVLEEKERAFKYQIKLYQLQAKYNPELNIDPETGSVSQEVLDRTEEELATGTDSETNIEDSETAKKATGSEEVETGQKSKDLTKSKDIQNNDI